MATTEQFIGQPVLRKEDPELLTGQASYIDNWTMPGMVWMALVRPPYVHATIDGIDTAEAASMPGVVGVVHGGRLPVRPAAVRLADHRGHQGAGPLPAGVGQDSVQRRRRGRRRRGDARAGPGCRRDGRGARRPSSPP